MAIKTVHDELNEVPANFLSETVSSLKQMHDLGKPETDKEVADRVDMYFKLCIENGFRPGVESLCAALHVSRTTLFNWNRGIKCSQERQEIINTAKSLIDATLEQMVLCGKISPPSGIFIMKNWLGYSDQISLEENDTQREARMKVQDNEILPISKLPILGDSELIKLSNIETAKYREVGKAQSEELPQLQNTTEE